MDEKTDVSFQKEVRRAALACRRVDVKSRSEGNNDERFRKTGNGAKHNVSQRTDQGPPNDESSSERVNQGNRHHDLDHLYREIQVTSTAGSTTGNQLLDAIPSRQRSQIVAQCEKVPMQFDECLGEKTKQTRHVHFPLTGFASLVISVDGHNPLELNMIGNEGMIGAELVLGMRGAPYTSVVQGSGTALRLDATVFMEQLETSPALHEICNRYFHVLIEQIAQSIACNSFHEVSQRLTRWLLMAHDRAGGDDLELTQAFLATMLGVRRSAVTIAAGNLQHQLLIRYSRGQISVLSRDGLEKLSCGCYAASIKTYANMLVPGKI